jgi:hypothetical protein
MVFVRRRPLLRAAVVGGGAFMAGRAMGKHSAQPSAATAPGAGAGARAEAGAGTGAGAGAPEPAREVPAQAQPGDSMLEQLSKLNALHTSGALTDDEFAAAKARLLAG